MAAERSGPALWCKLSSAGGAALENNNYLVREHVRPSRQQGFQPWIYRFAAYIFVSTLAAVCYVNSLRGELVHDDVFAIKNNPDVRPGTSLITLFRHDFWGRDLLDNASHKSYRPLTVLTFRLNYYLHGLDPWGYHVVNVVLHVLVTWLFTYICANHIFRNITLALFAGCIFAVHPVHTEAVSGVVGRADVLSCLLVLLSFYLYISKDTCSPTNIICRWLLPLGGVLLGAAAMFVKETGVTVLGICLIYDVINQLRPVQEETPPGVPRHRSPLRLIFLLLAIIGLVCFRLWLMGGGIPRFTEQDNPASFCSSILTRLLTYGFLAAFNAWLLICPSTLSYDWQMFSVPLVETLSDPRNIATLVFFLTLSAITIIMITTDNDNDQRVLSVGLLFLVLPFLPASNFFFSVGFVVAERILYTPSLGYTVLLVHGLDRLTIKFRRKTWLLYTSLVFLVVLLAARTVIRNQAWSSRKTLFVSGLQTLSHNAKMHYNYANLMKDLGDNKRAVQHYRETLRLWPDHASASNNLGTLLENPTEAELQYNKAIEISQGSHAGAHFNLANLYYQQGRKEEALQHVEAAVRLDPDCIDVYSSLAVMLEEAGRHRDAGSCYLKMAAMKPRDTQVMEQYAAFLNRIGQYDTSFEMYRKVYSQDPKNFQAMMEAARVLRSSGKLDEAKTLVERSLQVSQSATTMDTAGVFYFNLGAFNKAIMLFRKALMKDEENNKILIHLAQALASSGQYSDAEHYCQRALRRDPNHIEALQQMSKIYGVTGKHDQGLHYVDKALRLVMDPDIKAELLLEKGNHLKDTKQYEKAQKVFMEAVTIQPNLSEAQLNIGVLYHMWGDLDKAHVHYEKARVLDPNNLVLLENIRKLRRTR